MRLERRQFARIKVNLKLRFKSLEAFETMVSGSMGDLSRGGMFIRTDEAREEGSRVEIELPVPGMDPVVIQGTVRSVRREGKKQVGLGIEFDQLEDPALGVILYLLDKEPEK